LGNRPHETSVRARTVVRLRQLDSALFSDIAGTFAPFREVLSNSILQRSGDIWRRLSLHKAILEQESIASLLDPLPAQRLHKDVTLADAMKALSESSTGELMIVDEGQRLWGTLDCTNVHQIIAQIAVIPPEKRANITQRKLSEFLVGNTPFVTLEDPMLVASNTMLHHSVSWLPVVENKDDLRPIGYLRGERIINRLVEKIVSTHANQARAAS